MPDQKKYLTNFRMPNGQVIWIKDIEARQAASGGIIFIGVTTTPITDGSHTYPVVISGAEVYPQNGNLVVYNTGEFVWMDFDSSWHEFGSSDQLGALAHKDTASGSYTPSGTVSKPNVTVTENTVNVTEIASGGSVTQGSAASCTLPVMNMTYDSARSDLELSWTAGSFTPNVPTEVTLPTTRQTSVLTGVTAELDSTPEFTGSSSTITVD